MMPNRNRKALGEAGRRRRGLGLAEVMVSLLLLALVALAMFQWQSGTSRTVVKAGEVMVAGALLHNTIELYKTLPFAEIVDAELYFDENGVETPRAGSAFRVGVRVESVNMPNQWSLYKKIFLNVEKPGIFFGTTFLKTALIRVTGGTDAL